MPSKRIEALWADVLEARRKLDVVWEHAREAEGQLLSEDLPASDGQFAYRSALQDTKTALLRYSKALDTFKAAVLFGRELK